MKFHENLSSESRAVLCGRAEGHTEKNEEAHTGFSQFCESALKPTGSSNYTCKIPQYCTTPISRNSPTNSCTPPRLDSHSHTHHHYTTTTPLPLQSYEFARVWLLTSLNMLFTFVPFYVAHNWPFI